MKRFKNSKIHLSRLLQNIHVYKKKKKGVKKETRHTPKLFQNLEVCREDKLFLTGSLDS